MQIKNKISLASLFNEINYCVDEIDSLQEDPSDYEFDEIPDNVNEHLSSIKHLLEEICKKILVKKKSG